VLVADLGGAEDVDGGEVEITKYHWRSRGLGTEKQS
jgi:hypothetical protein